MMNLFRSGTLALFALLAFPSLGSCQGFYGRGGFSLRGPGFGIDVEPYGGFRAFGPFGGVDVRGYGFPPPSIFPAPPFPVPVIVPPPGWPGGRMPLFVPDVADAYEGRPLQDPVRPPRFDIPDYDDLNQRTPLDDRDTAFRPAAEPPSNMVAAIQRLRTALEQREDGDVWVDYLNLDLVSKLVATAMKTEMTQATQQTNLQTTASQLVVPFNAVSATTELTWLVNTEGFVEVRQLLNYLADPNASTATDAGGTLDGEGDTVPQQVDPEANETEVEELPAPQPNPIEAKQPTSIYRGRA